MSTKKKAVVEEGTIIFKLANHFTLKERMKVLFGHGVLNEIHFKITGTSVGAKIKLQHEIMGMKTWLGRPVKHAVPQNEPITHA